VLDPALRQLGLAHYEELARLGKAVSSPVRLQILDLLRQGPRSVDVLAERSGVSVANMSQHLQQLRAAHLVLSEKQGQRIAYRLSSADVAKFFSSLRALGEGLLPEIDRLRSALKVHSEPERAALLERIEGGEVTLLDVRPDEEWDAGHLPGAIHIPFEVLSKRLADLPKKKDVIAYCRGPFCPLAIAAVDLLNHAGFKACHLDLGPADLAERAPVRTTAPPKVRRKRNPT
jgi:DNA-binding transcriptional ArsR family regulator